jgi:hypothetical protein
VCKAIDGHFDAARYYLRLHRLIGGSAVVVTTVLTGFAFASLGQSVTIYLGLFSLVASILSSLDLWLRPRELAQSHLQAGHRYYAIRHEIEELSAMQHELDGETAEGIRARLDEAIKGAPSVPPRIFRKVQQAHSGVGLAGGKIFRRKAPSQAETVGSAFRAKSASNIRKES